MNQTRREFLEQSASLSTLLALGGAVPTFLCRTALAAEQRPAADQTILIVVQLSGGNDGLNTVIPYEDDNYARMRPTIKLTAAEVLKIDRSLLGFHPQMTAFMRLYERGQLTVVQGVGYPRSSRDHARAMRDWQTARPEEPNCQTGWLGRAMDQVFRPERADLPGVFVGQIQRPFALNARRAAAPSVRAIGDWRFRATSGRHAARQRDLIQRASTPPSDDPLLSFVRQNTVAACQVSQRIEAVQHRYSSSAAAYPSFGFAQRLRTVAQLIRAELGIRIFFTEHGGGGFGGFDNHANQRGNHGALLEQLAEGIAAFLDDLKRDRLLDRILLMTFSEFGRTAAENGRRGTDHGAAAPVFLAGGRLKGGLVGQHPSLSNLDNGALRVHTDFRSVYATVLDCWLGIDSRQVLGRRFNTLELLS